MGDRANIYVVQHPVGPPKGGVYLYTHWGGEDLPRVVQAALKRGRDRWDDECYLARILLSQMTRGDAMGTTGVGITTYLTDNDYPILVIDTDSATVGFARPGKEPKCFVSYSFEDFLALKKFPDWEPVD